MRTKTGLVLGLICLVFALGCGSSGPSGKVKEFVNLAAKKDYDGVLKLIHTNAQGPSRESNISSLSSNRFISDLSSYGVDSVEILRESESEKQASVDANIFLGSNSSPVHQHFELVKENGEWKVYAWEPYDPRVGPPR